MDGAGDPRPRPQLGPVLESPAPASAPSTRPGRSRRWFLAGGAALVAGAGAGVGAEFLRFRSPEPLPPPPAALVAAAEAERRLIADLTATTGGAAAARIVIEQARVNHRAHLAALEALLTAYREPSTPPSPPPGTPRTRVQLRAAEAAAATAAARRAETFHGARATLLASIAACETTHAELLA